MVKKMFSNPWSWVPSLYFAEGLPNVLVTVVAVTMYMQLGMSDTEIALYTSWLNLPWILKFLWSQFVVLYRTKCWWVCLMQLLIGASLAGVAFTLNASFWFQGTMCFFFLMTFASATHDAAADGYYMSQLDDHEQSLFIGIRNTFYRIAIIFGQSGMVALAGFLQKHFEGKAFTWSLVFYGLSGLFIALWLYHSVALPHAAAESRDNTSTGEVMRGMASMIVSFFTKLPVKTIVCSMLFIMFYRFPEAMLSKMSTTFLQRPVSEGGLALTLKEFGLANGFVGLIGLLLGGILGGWLASRDGLKKWLWPFVIALTLPDLVYVYMSYALPNNILLISTLLFIEQFGYGLGFTALTLFMLYFAQGEFKTSHYAVCTALSYLGMTLPGMVSGWLKDMLGYQHYFILVMVFCLITFAVTAMVKIDPEFGKKKMNE